MDKLKRYEHFDSRIGEDRVCMDDDVSALEDENERLKAENERLKKELKELNAACDEREW